MTTEKPSKEQLARLPVWAQQAFASLERELQSAKDEAVTLRAAMGEAPSGEPQGLVSWSVLMNDYPLPDHAYVRFHEAARGEKGYHRYVEAGFTKYDNQGERVLVIRGSEGIVIQPQASNVVIVRLRKQGLDE